MGGEEGRGAAVFVAFNALMLLFASAFAALLLLLLLLLLLCSCFCNYFWCCFCFCAVVYGRALFFPYQVSLPFF